MKYIYLSFILYFLSYFILISILWNGTYLVFSRVIFIEEDLLESEKCFDELPVFAKEFAKLEEKANAEKQKYDCVKEEIVRNFDESVLR